MLSPTSSFWKLHSTPKLGVPEEKASLGLIISFQYLLKHEWDHFWRLFLSFRIPRLKPRVCPGRPLASKPGRERAKGNSVPSLRDHPCKVAPLIRGWKAVVPSSATEVCPKSLGSSPRAGWFLLRSFRQRGRWVSDCHGLASPSGNSLLLFSDCFLAFFPVPGADLRCQQLITREILGLHFSYSHPICFCSSALHPNEKGKRWGKRSILYVSSALTFATIGGFCFNNVDKLSAHCFSPQWWALPQTHRHPPAPQTEICMQHAEGHSNNNGYIPQSQFWKHREWMKSPSVALYPAALIPWITSSEKGSAGHVGEPSQLLSATLPRLQQEKPLKLKKRVMVTEKPLWGVLISGKDSLVWNSPRLSISRECYKKHSSSHISDDHDIFRKRICASSITSEEGMWSPAVSVDSKLPSFVTLPLYFVLKEPSCTSQKGDLHVQRSGNSCALVSPHHPPVMSLTFQLLFTGTVQ